VNRHHGSYLLLVPKLGKFPSTVNVDLLLLIIGLWVYRFVGTFTAVCFFAFDLL